MKKIIPLAESRNCEILQGIRVVELASYVAAPICGRMLADYGAEVIKVERSTGDAWRTVGNNTNVKAYPDANPMFDILNSGKKSVVINLKSEAGIKDVKELISTADVLLTNSRMKSLEKMGLGPEEVMEANPSLIYAIMTGYGIEGPEKDAPGFDSTAFWARSGLLRDLPADMPGQYPCCQFTSVGDTIAGSLLFSGVLGAIIRRMNTGKGDFVTTSLLETGVWVNNTMVIMTEPKYGDKYPISINERCAFATYYRCSDNEWVQFGFMDYDRYMPVLLDVVGYPELIKNPKFADEPSCRLNMEEMLHILEERFMTKPSDEWLKLLAERDIFGSRLPHVSDLSQDRQAWANGYLEEYTMPNGDTCIMPCPPIRYGSTGSMHTTPAPYLGQDTESVLAEIRNRRHDQ